MKTKSFWSNFLYHLAYSDFRWYTDEHFFNSNLLAKKELAHDFTSNALNEANFFFTLFFFFGHGLQHAGS